MERSKQEFFNDNPQLKKMMELQDDTVALKKYMQEQYGGMTEEEMIRQIAEPILKQLEKIEKELGNHRIDRKSVV